MVGLGRPPPPPVPRGDRAPQLGFGRRFLGHTDCYTPTVTTRTLWHVVGPADHGQRRDDRRLELDRARTAPEDELTLNVHLQRRSRTRGWTRLALCIFGTFDDGRPTEVIRPRGAAGQGPGTTDTPPRPRQWTGEKRQPAGRGGSPPGPGGRNVAGPRAGVGAVGAAGRRVAGGSRSEAACRTQW